MERNGRVRRRRHQDGSLFKDSTGTRWMGRWWQDVVDPESGEVKPKRMYECVCYVQDCRSEREARRRLDRMIAEATADHFRPAAPLTFAEFAKKWQRDVLPHYKPSSQHSYRMIIENHLEPAFGRMQLRDISAETIQRFVGGWKLGPGTLRNVVKLLMVMWDHAIGWGSAQHNPFPRGTGGKLLLKMPALGKRKTYRYTLDETRAILEALPERCKLMVLTAAECGVRPGELAGMRCTDLDGRVISISQSAYRRKLQAPKTGNAIRQFVISQALADDLRAYMEANKDKPNKYGLVWPNTKGGVSDMDKITYKAIKPILIKLGIWDKLKALGVKGGFYPLRHMNISEMRRGGIPLKTIQNRVGHAEGSDVTDEFYVHADREDDEKAADLLHSLLSASGSSASSSTQPGVPLILGPEPVAVIDGVANHEQHSEGADGNEQQEQDRGNAHSEFNHLAPSNRIQHTTVSVIRDSNGQGNGQ